MMKTLFLPIVLLLSLGLSAGVSAAEKTADKAGKSKKAKKSEKTHLRLTLMPPLCVEQFVDTGLNLHRAPPPPAAAHNELSSPTGATSSRLGLQTGWGVAPFVGSALPPPAEAPERIPAANDAITGTTPFCDLDAGVSYSLGRSTNLNLGYRLPSSVWSGVLGPLREDGAAESSGKQVTIGIDIGF